MSTSRFNFLPLAAEYPATNFGRLTQSNRRPALAFDAVTNQTVYWTGFAPQTLTGTMTAVVSFAMASATTGNVGFQIAIEALAAGDAVDTSATTSFDTVNSSALTTVPGTVGYLGQITITLTNQDSIAVGDYFRLSLNRDAINDTATGDAYVFGVELRDAA